MKSRLPAFLSKDKICIICEGDEEYDYLNRLKELRVCIHEYVRCKMMIQLLEVAILTN